MNIKTNFSVVKKYLDYKKNTSLKIVNRKLLNQENFCTSFFYTININKNYNNFEKYYQVAKISWKVQLKNYGVFILNNSMQKQKISTLVCLYLVDKQCKLPQHDF